jgi:hypothetical protein
MSPITTMPHALPMSFPEPDADSLDVLEGVDVLLDGVALPGNGVC